MSDSPQSPDAAPAESSEPEDLDAPEFDPVPLRARHDGWTPDRQADFIQALAETACVADACRAVGMSERSAYSLRARIEAVSFRNAWEAALDYGIRRLSDAVVSRAINGVPVPIFYQGEQVGERRRYDERLAVFLLRYRDPLRYGKWNDRREFRGHPEGHAFELAQAKVAIREDGSAPTEDLVKTWKRRLRQIGQDILRVRRLES